MANVFCITYGGRASNGNTYVPYRAIAHTAEEAIAVINSWKTYGRKTSEDCITVNDVTAEKIRTLFRDGFGTNALGEPVTYVGLRTKGCGAWDIGFHPALADTLEEHERIYGEQRERAKAERMRQAEAAKQRRLGELYEQKQGWYRVTVEIRMHVFADKGNDFMPFAEYSATLIADSGMDAYHKTKKFLQENPDEIRHKRGMAILQSVCAPTSSGYDFTFLGMKVDGGYSVEAWEEWKRNGEKN